MPTEPNEPDAAPDPEPVLTFRVVAQSVAAPAPAPDPQPETPPLPAADPVTPPEPKPAATAPVLAFRTVAQSVAPPAPAPDPQPETALVPAADPVPASVSAQDVAPATLGGFVRRRRQPSRDAAAAPVAPEPVVTPEPVALPEPVLSFRVVAQSVAPPAPAPDPQPETPPLPAADPVTPPEPGPAAIAPVLAFRAVAQAVAPRAPAPLSPIPDATAPMPVIPPPSIPATQPADPTAIEPTAAPRQRREWRRPTTPGWLIGWAAAAVAGAVAGLVMVLGTALALQGCELARGTASCGGGPGILLLVVLTALGVLVGAAVLRLGGVDGSVSTSLLGVGLLAVLVVVFLLGSVYAWWMLLAVPLLCAATFVGSHWVSTTFADPDPAARR